MCGIKPQRSVYISYYISVYLSTIVCTCTVLNFAPSLGGGHVQAYIVTVEPNPMRNLVLLGILGFTIYWFQMTLYTFLL